MVSVKLGNNIESVLAHSAVSLTPWGRGTSCVESVLAFLAFHELEETGSMLSDSCGKCFTL